MNLRELCSDILNFFDKVHWSNVRSAKTRLGIMSAILAIEILIIITAVSTGTLTYIAACCAGLIIGCWGMSIIDYFCSRKLYFAYLKYKHGIEEVADNICREATDDNLC